MTESVSGRWQSPQPGLEPEVGAPAPRRRGGWFAFTLLLLVALLALLFLQLFAETRELLTQEEVQRRHQKTEPFQPAGDSTRNSAGSAQE